MSIALLCLVFNELLDVEIRSAFGKCVNPLIWLILLSLIILSFIKKNIAKTIHISIML